MGRFIFWLIALYVLYNFVIKFLLPVISASLKLHSTMQNMRDGVPAQQERSGQQEATTKNTANAGKQPVAAKEDYIDFEEIK